MTAGVPAGAAAAAGCDLTTMAAWPLRTHAGHTAESPRPSELPGCLPECTVSEAAAGGCVHSHGRRRPAWQHRRTWSSAGPPERSQALLGLGERHRQRGTAVHRWLSRGALDLQGAVRDEVGWVWVQGGMRVPRAASLARAMIARLIHRRAVPSSPRLLPGWPPSRKRLCLPLDVVSWCPQGAPSCLISRTPRVLLDPPGQQRPAPTRPRAA